MTDIAPLRPLRYSSGELADVVAPPYDVINDAERAELLRRSPHNVVRLILPEGSVEEKHAHAGRLFGEWQSTGVLTRDPLPSFYRYDQTFTPPGEPGASPRTRSGFLALVRLTPLGEGSVLPHERTLAAPKEDRLKLFRATQANLSPGFMLYRDTQQSLARALEPSEWFASFRTGDGIAHRLGRISEPEAMAAITAHVREGRLLIADGHHRYETALRYAAEVDAHADARAPYAALPEHRYFMAYLSNADDPALLVCATHRLVHSLPRLDWPAFLDAARREFTVTPLPANHDAVSHWTATLAAQHEARAAFVAVAASPERSSLEAVLLTLRDDIDLGVHPSLQGRPMVVRGTSVAILHGLLLESILGISLSAQEQKTNVDYLQDPGAGLAAIGRGDGQVLFLLQPSAVSEVRAVAEAGEVMPQKSTFFYPKVLTGLAIHTLHPHRSVVFPAAPAR